MDAALNRAGDFASLLAAAHEAECIARDIAAAQARIAPDSALQRALRQQGRQEMLHAAVFASALACLPGRAGCPPAVAPALAGFRRNLEEDVRHQRLAASMFGLQHVLEALGHLALQPPPGELSRLGDRFVPVRRLLAQQELGHRRLGEIWVPRAARQLCPEDACVLRQRMQGYLALAEETLAAGLAACAAFESDRSHYERESRDCLLRLREQAQAIADEPR